MIVLNRPEVINALTSEMIDAVAAALAGFLADDDVRMVLFEGAGERGFCAGGDVREVRRQMLEGDVAGVKRFFAAEYAMNLVIAEATKPIAVLADGVVMGGGIGIAGHVQYRFCTERCRFAMPEGAIGFHCDVGVNGILAKAQRHLALAFLMSGAAVGAADALALGLTDCVINADEIGEIRGHLIAAAEADDVDAAITHCMQAHGIEAGEAGFVAEADRMADAFGGGSAGEILRDLREVADAGAFVEGLTKRCPTSLVISVLSLDAARADMDMGEVLKRDYRLAVWMAQRADFSEGVRAVLVDKDRNPVWDPAELDAVDTGPIGMLISG